MLTLLPSKQVVVLGPELGLCIAMGTPDGVVVGHLFRGQGFEPPPADLRTRLCDEDFVYVEALSPDGLAFIELLRGQ